MSCGSFESEKLKRFEVWFCQKISSEAGKKRSFKLSNATFEMILAEIKLTFFPEERAWTTLFQLNKKRSRHIRLTLNTVILDSVNRAVRAVKASKRTPAKSFSRHERKEGLERL